MIRIFTIGFAQKTAEEFFDLLNRPEISKLIDIRESNTNIYAGFTMKQNLPFFLRKILGIDYTEEKRLAPTKEIRDIYHKDRDWERYARNYLALIESRNVKKLISPSDLDSGVLLCSEPTPEFCHRRLAAEYFKQIWEGVEIVHL